MRAGGEGAFRVLLFYRYVTIEDPKALADRIRERCVVHNLRGRVLVAEEGINGTLEGTVAAAEAFADELRADPRFTEISIKRSAGTGNAFPKLAVKVRRQIVGTGFGPEIDPRVRTGKRLAPEELRAWFESGKDFVIVDMRNDYEYRSGRFAGSVNPGLENSRDLPEALPKLAPYKERTVLTVCTGGVRCEPMSAYLLEHGFTDVYQLEDGMHGYLEKYPGQDFEGALYTFDGRVTMDFGGDRSVVGKCALCDAPTEAYANCAYDPCHKHFLACAACTAGEAPACSETCVRELAGARSMQSS